MHKHTHFKFQHRDNSSKGTRDIQRRAKLTNIRTWAGRALVRETLGTKVV